MATGLAWTEAGGETLYVEAMKMQGKGNLSLTGSLGEVMKESAQAALSYARAHAADLGIDNRDILPERFPHPYSGRRHPQGDGPSAGVTIATAFISLCTDIKVRWDVAMTGEITLRGNILPVGGVKEKVLAAQRMGIKRMIMPLPNKKDLFDIPKGLKDWNSFSSRTSRKSSGRPWPVPSPRRRSRRREKRRRRRLRSLKPCV